MAGSFDRLPVARRGIRSEVQRLQSQKRTERTHDVARHVINEAVWVVLALATHVAFIDQTTTGFFLCVCSSCLQSQMGHVEWFRPGNVTLSSAELPPSANGGNIQGPLAQLPQARPDFSLSATPFLQTTTPGNNATFGIAVAPVISTSGFYGDIFLS